MNIRIQFFATLFILSIITVNAEASILYTGSTAYGGDGGRSFILPEVLANGNVSNFGDMKKISIKVSDRIEKIQVTWSMKRGGTFTEGTGENGGTWQHINLANGEYITKVTGKTGRFVNQVTFYTNYRRKFGPYGGNEGTPFQIVVPAGYKVFGFFGNSGQCIDKLGLVYEVDEDKINNNPPVVARPPSGNQSGDSSRPAPRPSTTNQQNVRDHRKQTTGRKPTIKKRTSNTVDHRKDSEKERREWLIKNGFDPDRAGG